MRIALRRQVDKMMDAYVDWHEACLLVSDAYRFWSNATSSDLTIAFRWYLEALDREERAAAIYERLVRRVGDLASAGHDLPARLGEPTSRAR
jgi:hypothetical protein